MYPASDWAITKREQPFFRLFQGDTSSQTNSVKCQEQHRSGAIFRVRLSVGNQRCKERIYNGVTGARDHRVPESTMGQLARYLQDQFIARTPRGWTCAAEARVLDTRFKKLLGYAPQADVLLASNDGLHRLWIEFEVSRADPVANHAKFATAHLFQPQKPTDTFVSMMSSHVARGRRNLAANTVLLMRRIGMKAFQTVLLPTVAPLDIKRMNIGDPNSLPLQSLDVDAEIDRALAIAKPYFDSPQHRIHFVGEPLDVACNIATWNRELQSEAGRQLWGRRRVRYFAFDPSSGEFAPAKFCAFLNARLGASSDPETLALPMTMELYVSLDESEPRFDGNRAQQHLTRKLGMVAGNLDGSPADDSLMVAEDRRLSMLFHYWHARHKDAIQLDPKAPIILRPPVWYQ